MSGRGLAVYNGDPGHRSRNPARLGRKEAAASKLPGIRDGRLHEARHTAATVLLLLGVGERTIMAIIGWSNPAMTRRYARMIDPIRRETASRIDGLLWEADSLAESG